MMPSPFCPGTLGGVEENIRESSGRWKYRKPEDYPSIGFDICSFYDANSGAFAGKQTRAVLNVMRYVAMAAQRTDPDGLEEKTKICIRTISYDWVDYLVSEESSSRGFFLQTERAIDDLFYETNGSPPNPTLQPKCRSDWDKNGWKETLGWLKHPERLTVTEFELALVIFKWDGKDPKTGKARPEFNWWVLWRPHILWRVHAFLLKRYCFDLLRPFKKALKNGKINSPPYRSGELWTWYPRMFGLTTIGVLALLNLPSTMPFFFKGGGKENLVAYLILVILISFWLVCILFYLDVFRQNRGVFRGFTHGFRRIVGAIRRFILAGLLPSFIAGAWWCDFVPAWSLSEAIRFVLGVLGLGGSACIIGALLQWFWEDKAATEPM